jgi:putative exosortase-associated protein (TIGR04073 family)
MRNTVFLLAAVAALGTLAGGCANAEKKFGRGMRNSYEVVRLGEMRRSVEQTALFEGPEVGYTTGFVIGFNRTLARTGLGVFEVLTAPLPPYKPLFTSYLAPNPVYPDSYRPGLIDEPTFATDTMLGFSGGDIAPFIPGSRFKVFDGH